MHTKRVLTALVFIPLFILLVLKGGSYPFFALITVAALLGLNEFYHLWGNKLAPPYKILGMVLGGLLCLVFGLCSPLAVNSLLTLAILLVLLRSLWQQRSEQKPSSQLLLSLGGTLVGLLYVVWLLGHLIWLRRLPQGREAVFLVFLITWSSDTAAYYVGSAIGRHRLAPKISPGKSVEGAAAGLIAGVLASYLAAGWFYPLPAYQALLLGVFLGVSIQLGDLCESLLKRAAQVKDSGGLVPGHGGMLDRLDGLLFSAPCLYYYLKLVSL